MALCKVVFTPQGKSVTVESGTSLLEAAAQAGMTINSVCGGDGICGRCKMVVTQGRVSGNVSSLLTRDEVQEGVVLACQCFVEGDLAVEIPEETRAREKVALDRDAQRFRAVNLGVSRRAFARSPLVAKLFLELEPPSLDDNVADCQRLEQAIADKLGLASMQTGLKVLKRIPRVLRENDYRITATVGRRQDIAEIMDIEGGDTSQTNYLAVVDVGTSTIVVHLVDAQDMTTVAAGACFNSQAIHGREVTARMMYAEREGSKRLQEDLVEDINGLVSGIASQNSISLKDINAVVCSGNTTMNHFLLGLPTRNIRRNPFIATTLEPPPLRAAEVGIKVNPRGLLFSVPGIGSWVGGDITAGILATGLYDMQGVGMLVDIGTNGEIVIGNSEWLVAVSASVGPALEGASVECGMVAETGAIETVCINGDDIEYKVIGDAAPQGICGSGIIDLVAVLLDKGIVDRAGAFVEGADPRLTFANGRGRFALVPADRNAAGKEIFINQDDIDNIVTAKAAIFAATKIILDRLDLAFSDIEKLFLAGGFGSFVNRQNAVKIGLLPDLPLPSIQYVGNTSIWGATFAAFSHEAYQLLRQIRKRTTYYDLLGSDDYVEQFRQAMFLPHTNIELFPSLADRTS